MDWLTILPPLIAIAVVLWKKEVILALIIALLSSEVLQHLADGVPGAIFLGFLATIEQIVSVFGDAGNSRILMFSLLIGALIACLQASGGFTALVQSLIRKGLAKSRKQASLLPGLLGVMIFIESNLSVLTAGVLSRSLFDRFGLSRARLAYIIDSTSSPISILILLNAWGAYILGLLGAYDLENPVEVLAGTIFLNFYALVTLLIVFITIFTDRTFGTLKTFEENNQSPPAQDDTPPKEESSEPAGGLSFLILPMTILIGGMLAFMAWTGNGEMARGSGSKSVLYATILAIFTIYVMMVLRRGYTHQKMVKISFSGMGELLPLVCILLLSMALGSSLKDLGTGLFMAGLISDTLPLFMVVPLIFLTGALVSFSTGTSWGTFAILIPLGMPLVAMLDLPASLVLAAILGGGVFGDHCSPISDSTAVSSMAAGCDHLDHVRTQLPYALTAGTITFFGYMLCGLFL